MSTYPNPFPGGGANWCTCESVVQRQMWLMENTPDLTERAAYDLARKEFYDLRMQEDIERRVAAEEALMVGSRFGKSYLDLGIEMEERALESWRNSATADILKRRQRSTFAISEFVDEADEAAAAEPKKVESAPVA